MDSLLNQTLTDIEIIMVDDESPDNCPAMCDEYAKLDSRIKVIHKKNEGLGFARNSGLEIAKGEFVGFIDSDDFVDVIMYETLYNTAKGYDLDTVFCSCNFYKDKRHIKHRKEVDELTLFIGRKAVDSFLLDMIGAEPSYISDVKYMMSACRSIYSRKLIENTRCRFHSERELVSEDMIFNFDYLTKAEKVGYVPFYFYFYCFNENSISHTYNEGKDEKIKYFLSEVKSLLSDKFSEEVYSLHYKRMLLLHFRIVTFENLKLAKKEKKLKNKIKIIKKCNDSFWSQLFVDYPYWKLPIKHRLFYFFSKPKLIRIWFNLFLYILNLKK
jgi:glycosyltransferase involved in cell wall biosynthesis